MTYTCQDVVIDTIQEAGPQERQILRRECREKATPYDNLIFAAAMGDLLASGRIIIQGPRNSTDTPIFDLPAEYYR